MILKNKKTNLKKKSR